MSQNDDQDASNNNSLMTPASQALALSPPRAPPHDSAHRTILLAKSPKEYALAHHHEHSYHHDLRHRIMHLLEKSHLTFPSRIPHPHLPAAPEWGDKVTRALGVMLPIPWLNACRDSGAFRSIIDTVITVTAPTMAIASPSIALEFTRLTRSRQRLKYGSHIMHVIDILFPSNENSKGLMVFVHGGAWGSGLPWMYRLVASPFLELNMAVAIVGYRTWPDGNVQDQVNDLQQACNFIASTYPDLCSSPKNCIMGHSSGAHIALLLLVDRAKQAIQTGVSEKLQFDSFVGLSGPYDISHHFDYEAARGVEELSPMKPVCGHSRLAFESNSPAPRLRRILADLPEEFVGNAFPRKMLLVHGIEDATVPFTATAEASRIFRSCGVSQCEEAYVARIRHQDTVVQVMLGGKTRDVVVSWLQSDQKAPAPLVVDSKL